MVQVQLEPELVHQLLAWLQGGLTRHTIPLVVTSDGVCHLEAYNLSIDLLIDFERRGFLGVSISNGVQTSALNRHQLRHMHALTAANQFAAELCRQYRDVIYSMRQ